VTEKADKGLGHSLKKGMSFCDHQSQHPGVVKPWCTSFSLAGSPKRTSPRPVDWGCLEMCPGIRGYLRCCWVGHPPRRRRPAFGWSGLPVSASVGRHRRFLTLHRTTARGWFWSVDKKQECGQLHQSRGLVDRSAHSCQQPGLHTRAFSEHSAFVW
jgi:hypothetical protein